MAKPTIAELKHRMKLCSMKDVVTERGTMVLIRKDVLSVWAKVEPKQASMFSPAGYAVEEPRNRQTHIVTIRTRTSIDISSAAWLFEARRKSGDRWFKVLGVRDGSNDGEFTVLSCRLVERGDDLVQPVGPKEEVEAKPGFAIVDHGVKL